MTFEKTSGEAKGSEEVLAVLHSHVDRALMMLDLHINDLLQDGKPTSATLVVKAAQDAHKAVLLLFEERKKIDQSRNKTDGAAPEGVLDLEAARDEIWRRLACLRDASATGELPE